MMGSEVNDYFEEQNERGRAELAKKPLTKEELAKLIGTHPLDAWLCTVWMTLETHGYKIVKK